MDVMINRGVEWRDDLRQVKPELWSELIEEYRWFCQRNLPNDCRHLLRMITEGEAVGWAGYQDRERYLRDGLGLDPVAVDWALHGLSLAGAEAPIGFKEAQKLGRQGAPAGNRNAAKDKPENKSYNVTFVQRGNAKAYRESKSARDGVPSTYYREKPLTTLRRVWKRASPEERAEFLREARKQ